MNHTQPDHHRGDGERDTQTLDTLAERIRHVFDQKGCTHIARKLGDRVVVSPETVRRYLNGKGPSVAFVEAVCAVTGTRSDWLLRGEGEPTEAQQRVKLLAMATDAEIFKELLRRVICHLEAHESESEDERSPLDIAHGMLVLIADYIMSEDEIDGVDGDCGSSEEGEADDL